MLFLAPEQIVLIVWSAINATLSAIVMYTPAQFPNLQKQTFVQLMFWTAVCTFATSFGTWIGFPDDGSAACGVQSFIISFFVKASWFWLTLTAAELFWIFQFDEDFFSEGFINRLVNFSQDTVTDDQMTHIVRHSLVWSVSLFLTLIPLSDSAFGRTDDGRDSAMCFLSGSVTDKKVLAWSFVTVYVPFFLCLLALLFFAIQLHCSLKEVEEGQLWGPIQWQMVNLFLYPVYFITWLPFVVISIIDNLGEGKNDGGYNFAVDFGNILSTQLGTFVFLIFFITSYEARHRWLQTLFCPRWKVSHYDTDPDLKQPLCPAPHTDASHPDPGRDRHETVVVEDNWCGQRSNRLTTVRNNFPKLFKFLGQFMPDALIQYKVADDAPLPQDKPSATKFAFP